MQSKSVHTNTQYPLAFFARVNVTSPRNESLDWLKFCELLADHSQMPYQQKADAPLFSPTHFRGSRSAINATESGLIVLDADYGLAVDDALTALREVGIAAVLYTTASHRLEGKGDRFRIIVPLNAPVDVETHKRVGSVVARVAGGDAWKPDTGKLGCYSLFYLPGLYEGIDNRFEVLDGTIFAAEDWLALTDVESEDTANPPSVQATA